MPDKLRYFANILLVLFYFIEIHLKAQETEQQTGEKVYLHTDRDIYNTGDDIWFSAYVIDALTNKPSPNTNNLHVELISPGPGIIQSRILKIRDGLGHGDFIIADSLPGGRYHIRAYTNHMRNYDEEFFFDKEIVIINPELQVMDDPAELTENRFYLNFYPEGGSLVEDVSSLVAFKAIDASGHGRHVRGRLYSSDGNLVTSFESSHLGMGTFILKPSPGLSYHAIAYADDSTSYRAELPVIFQEGISIHAFPTHNDSLLVKILTNKQTLPSLSGKEMILTLSSRNLLTSMLTFKINSTVNNFHLPLTRFPEGILRLTLSLPGGLPFAERLVFINRNRSTGIKISAGRDSYRGREEVSIRLSVEGDTALKACLSLSAHNIRMKTDSVIHRRTIASWFLLESDVHGFVEEPSRYFDLSNTNRLSELDLLLLTQGWRDFSWKYDNLNFFRHEIGFTVSGHVGKNRPDQPYAGAKVNLGIFDQSATAFMTTSCDSSGRFKVEGLDINGRARILASCANRKEKLLGWIFIDSIPYKPPNIVIRQNEKGRHVLTEYSILAEESRRIRLTGEKFRLSDTLNIGEVFVTERRPETAMERRLQSARSNYGRPDRELIVTKQMEHYPDVLRMMNARLPGVEVHSVEGFVKIRGEIPLILIDGVPSDRPLGNISPSEVDRIDVLYWSSPYGSRGANGIINVITRIGDYNYDALNMSHSQYTFINGFDIPRIFYSPVHPSTSSAGMSPDNRQTLFWKPDIISAGKDTVQLKFHNGDILTEIEVEAEGITSTGIPLYDRIRYKITAR